jgi:hypothetical protein
MLSMENIKRKTTNVSKLQSKFEGPMEVVKYYLDTDNIKLKLPPGWKIHDIFHTSLIKPYNRNDDIKFPGRSYEKPGPAIPLEVDPEGNVYEIEAI